MSETTENGLRALWRDLADKGIEHGVDWPYIARVLFANLDDANARAAALSAKIDRCEAHMRVLLGHADGEPDAGLEAMIVRAKNGALPPAAPTTTGAEARGGQG